MSHIRSVPSIEAGNAASHAIGLGQMNLHGYLAREGIAYGSPEALDFTNLYFYTITWHALRTSMLLARERGETFAGFKQSRYASGEYFSQYLQGNWQPKTAKVGELFARSGITLPTREMWAQLRDDVMRYGIYNQNLQAVPPTGSISYINHATSSIHPIVAKVEIRKEGKTGRVYYPAPFMTNENLALYQDAYRNRRRKDHRHLRGSDSPCRSGAVADAVFPRYRHHSRYQQSADLRLAQGYQNALLHSPASDGAGRH